MVQGVHILVVGAWSQSQKKRARLLPRGVQVIIQQAGAAGRLQGQPVGVVLNKG
jgi:hypothetical protein